MINLTIKLPVICDEKITNSLYQTVCRYTESFNRVSIEGWQQKRINGVELHKLTYYKEKELSKLPSQLVCSARVKATEALKSAKSNLKNGRKVSVPRSIRCPIRYDARSYRIDFSKNIASLATIEGRKIVNISIPEFYKAKLSWKVCSADLCMTKNQKFFLHVSIETEEQLVKASGKVIGVDLGINRPAVTSDNKFFGEKRWKEIEARNFRLKRQLQAKGTKSAKKHLKILSWKVNRFRKDCDHVLSKKIVTSASEGDTIVLEILKNIRKRVKARKKERRKIHAWSFERLRTFLSYKSKLYGVFVDYVDPRYTSQRCSDCGHIEKSNRKQSWFKCKACGFQHNADLNAARNIRFVYLDSKGISVTIGPHVNRPIVSAPARDKLPALAGSY